MRKSILSILLAFAIPMIGMAQDDMYFVPTKKNVEESAQDFGMPSNTYYSGSQRSVDDYNRRSYVQSVDSVGNDVITFSQEMGVYPDSIGGDYEYTRQMSRFDDYAWVDAYSAGYRDGFSSSTWGWYDSWYYDPWYYGSWYGGWYGWHHPWRHGWYYSGWYDPWYHPYYHHHWHGGWYGGGVSHRPYRGITGTSNHGRVNRGNGHATSSRRGSFSGYRGNNRSGNSVSNSSFGNNRNSSYNRNNSGSFGSNRSSMGSSSSRSGGSFGGSGGGSRGGGGGGSFGGRR